MNVDELEELSAGIQVRADQAAADILREAANTVARGTTDPARYAAVRGVAYFVVSRLSGNRADLNQAIALLTEAEQATTSPSRKANLAVALLDRGERDGSAADYRQAIGLLSQALAEPNLIDEFRLLWVSALCHAYFSAVQYNLGVVTLDELIDLGESVVERFPGLDSGGVEGLLGASYMLAAQRGHARANLDRMVDLLAFSVAELPSGHPDLPGRKATLGGALGDRYQITGAAADLTRGLVLLAEAFADYPKDDPTKALALNNWVNAVLADYERTGDPAGLQTMRARLAELAAAFAPPHPMFPVVMSNAGLLTRQAAHALERPELIDEAVRFHEQAVACTEPDHPALPVRLAMLAVALGDRYARDGDVNDLSRAIELGTRGLDSTSSHDVELAGFADNLGNYLHARYQLEGRMSDLRKAAELHERGLRVVRAGHHARAKMLSNAGIVWLDLYQRSADPADLDRAARHLDEAVRCGATNSREQAGYLVNLANTRRMQAAIRHTERHLAEAEVLAHQARPLAHGREVRAAVDGLLADIQRDRLRGEVNDQALLALLLDLDARLDPQDPAEHLRRGVIRGLANDEDAELRHLMIALETGIERRPEAAIAAAKLLADLGLRWFVSYYEEGLDLVERAAAGAMAARDQLIGTGEGRTADLSWHRELSGLGALWAHSRWLCGKLDEALAAFDATRAVLLSPYFPAGHTHAVVDAAYLALWCTPIGGAAVVVRPNAAPASVALPDLTPASVARLAERLSAAALLGPESLDRVLTLATEWISRTITRPLERILLAGESVVCAAGGALGLLPLGAGEVAGRPLITRHPLIYALHRRSAAWASRAGARPLNVDDVVSVACPTPTVLRALPAAARESEHFAPPRRRRHGPEATPAVLLDAFRAASLVHVATHATTLTNDPLAQYFVLAQDAPLFADAILEAAPLSARLAVLSGCGTGRTTVPHADEGLALASAVHAAGVPGVLSALWSVLDLPTARFMRTVVANLREGRTPPSALRDAQLTAIAEGRRTADWAAFTLLGC